MNEEKRYLVVQYGNDSQKHFHYSTILEAVRHYDTHKGTSICFDKEASFASKGVFKSISGKITYLVDVLKPFPRRGSKPISPYYNIFAAIKEEMQRQDAKWGSERRLSPFSWLSILLEETGEVASELNDWFVDYNPNREINLRKELVECGAVIFQMIRALDDKRFQW